MGDVLNLTTLLSVIHRCHKSLEEFFCSYEFVPDVAKDILVPIQLRLSPFEEVDVLETCGAEKLLNLEYTEIVRLPCHLSMDNKQRSLTFRHHLKELSTGKEWTVLSGKKIYETHQDNEPLRMMLVTECAQYLEQLQKILHGDYCTDHPWCCLALQYLKAHSKSVSTLRDKLEYSWNTT